MDNSNNKKIPTRGSYTINTSGGAYIGGNVESGGGDFIGRDRIIIENDEFDENNFTMNGLESTISLKNSVQGVNVQGGLSQQDIENLLKPLHGMILNVPAQDQDQFEQWVDKYREILSKGPTDNDYQIADLIDNMAELYPASKSAFTDMYEEDIIQPFKGPATTYVLYKIGSA